MIQEDKHKLKEWKEYLKDIANATPVEANLSEAEIARKRAWLETRPVEWIKYFFPSYAKYPFAPFHIKAIKRMINNDEWFEVLSWSRELAKSTIVMFVVLFLVLSGRKKNVILAAATQDAAERLLRPYKANLEANGRLKAFYGDQVNLGQWTGCEFVLKNGASFLGIGAGNAPRGSRAEAVRPDILLLDDFDTDADCRNKTVLDKKWEWWEEALYPTRSVSEPTLIVFCGNIIAKDTCVGRAGAKADHWDVVNIIDKDGNSTWPEKNTPEHIARLRSKISTKAFQQEYMNNPIYEGKIFKNLPYGKIPPLRKFQFIVIYGDPAYSNSTTAKKNSKKAVFALGYLRGTYYVLKGFCANDTNDNYIEWYYTLMRWIDESARYHIPVYCVQENNTLQNPFFEQVFMPIVRDKNKTRWWSLHLRADERQKGDKATRIEASLEPLDREGRLIFNEDEKDNPHMQELIDEFKLFEMHLPYCADGPDCIEGGIFYINSKIQQITARVDTIKADDLIDKRNRM